MKHRPDAETEHWLKAVFDHAFQYIGVLSRDGTVLQANPSSLRSHGIRDDEVLGRPFWQTPWWVHSPELQERLRQAITLAAGGDPDRFEATHPAPDGSLIHVDFSLTPVKAADGTVKCLIAEGRDITELRQHQDAIQRRDTQLRRLLDAALRLSAEHDLESLLQNIADAARDVIGCRYAALGVLNTNRDALESFVASGLSPDQIRGIGPHPKGLGVLGLLMKQRYPIRLVDLSKHAESFGFPPGHPMMRTFLGVPVIGRDGPIGNLYLTEKNNEKDFDEEDEAAATILAAEAAIAVENVQLLTELRNLQRSRDLFYAMVNHELRNAMTGVYGWSELFLRRNPNEIAAAEVLESADHAIQLLNDLLDLSRLDAERIQVHVDEHDFCAVLDEAVRSVEPLADEMGMAISVESDESIIECETDARRVKQIAINLLRNAVRHSGGRDILLKMASDAAWVTFQVIDHGEGIGEDQQAIIFDAYKRAESKVGGGTGLGLTLSARLAQLLGGDITVQSELGRGATFTVRLARSLPR